MELTVSLLSVGAAAGLGAVCATAVQSVPLLTDRQKEAAVMPIKLATAGACFIGMAIPYWARYSAGGSVGKMIFDLYLLACAHAAIGALSLRAAVVTGPAVADNMGGNTTVAGAAAFAAGGATMVGANVLLDMVSRYT